ncbi:hypothetical protein [Burkholderia ubonensis]|uniref:hypothetical protein n=1 Tax=Burkholderia ubonensis TaxID=101571 RepID=UPI000AB3DE00|nr:hypothetical protein [Burkholderia ubonensis]
MSDDTKTNPPETNNYKIGQTVRYKPTMTIWKIVGVGSDWLDCEKKIKRKKMKQRFSPAEVEPYFATGAVGITIYR